MKRALHGVTFTGGRRAAIAKELFETLRGCDRCPSSTARSARRPCTSEPRQCSALAPAPAAAQASASRRGNSRLQSCACVARRRCPPGCSSPPTSGYRRGRRKVSPSAPTPRRAQVTRAVFRREERRWGPIGPYHRSTTRAWCSGCTRAFQALSKGSIPFARLAVERCAGDSAGDRRLDVPAELRSSGACPGWGRGNEGT